LRPHRLPRKREDRSGQRRQPRDASARPARSVRGNLRPNLPVLDDGVARSQLRRGRRADASAWMHRRKVLHWTDNKLSIDWADVPDVVVALGDAIDELYWRSIDRPEVSHWLAAYDLVASTLTPHPASVWAKGPKHCRSLERLAN